MFFGAELNWVEKSTGLWVRKSEIESLLNYVVVASYFFNFFDPHLYDACLTRLTDVFSEHQIGDC